MSDKLKDCLIENGVEEVSPESDWETSSEESMAEERVYEETSELCKERKKRRTLEENRTDGIDNAGGGQCEELHIQTE